ncbi:hypothetical protein I3271_07235 [Photobacterium leiognathi]|uniref:hypothetical protein n=1 Tax=Photobacterium leiognathi TaxID=553611 RepID=UPI001EDDC38C|nr:hypothetical protein [Photobacterium leiognathi]MCG3884479.1 hypothetical protein [Photobacterium leiognathi]
MKKIIKNATYSIILGFAGYCALTSYLINNTDNSPAKPIDLSEFRYVKPPFLPTPLSSGITPPAFISYAINDANTNNVPDSIERYVWQKMSDSYFLSVDDYNTIIGITKNFFAYSDCLFEHNYYHLNGEDAVELEAVISAPYYKRELGRLARYKLPPNRLISAIISSEAYKEKATSAFNVDIDSIPHIYCEPPT